MRNLKKISIFVSLLMVISFTSAFADCGGLFGFARIRERERVIFRGERVQSFRERERVIFDGKIRERDRVLFRRANVGC